MDLLFLQPSFKFKRKWSFAPILDQSEEGKSFKIITVTNRIDEHTADYAKDYIKLRI
jgi:peptidyl-prolyl cis-trans isomerase SurA